MKNNFIKGAIYGEFALCGLTQSEAIAQQTTNQVMEKYRPDIHFKPKTNWMNDPDGAPIKSFLDAIKHKIGSSFTGQMPVI